MAAKSSTTKAKTKKNTTKKEENMLNVVGEKNPILWFVYTIKNTFNYNGRARRLEYCSFKLIAIVLMTLLSLVLITMHVSFDDAQIITLFVTMLFLLPDFSVTIRRLHDVNLNGLWYFVCFVPVFGALFSIMLFFLKGTNGANDYGK